MNDLSPGSSGLADVKLQAALGRLSSTAGSTFDDVMDSMGESISDTVESLSQSVVKGVKDIKAELDITGVARENPWGLVVGSFVGGAMFEYTTSRLKRTSTFAGEKRSYQSQTQTQIPSLTTPILLAITRWGIKRFLS